jgi:hypothetical protein
MATTITISTNDKELLLDIWALNSDNLNDSLSLEDDCDKASMPTDTYTMVIEIIRDTKDVLLFLTALFGLIKQYKDNKKKHVKATISNPEENPEVGRVIKSEQKSLDLTIDEKPTGTEH